jgi:hypothetical protein
MAHTGPPLVCTVSTVKDSLANVTQFVTRNLSAGADHMFVFLDEPAADIEHYLAGVPQVTTVTTDAAYWQGRRPESVNPRQIINANLVNTALTAVPAVRWLFHLDGDEALHIDKSHLSALGDEISAVRLETLEAVSQPRWDGPVTHFKRQLDHDELCLLSVLGVIDEPEPLGYFRGHLKKPGMRPSLDLILRIHHVESRRGRPPRAHASPSLQLLHYESHSSEEFARKWLTHLDNGKPRHRGKRDWLRNAVRSVTTNPALDEAQKHAYLVRLHARTAADDLERLDSLGFLVPPDESRQRYTPTAFDPADQAVLTTLMGRLCVADKSHFQRKEGTPHPAELLRSVRAEAGPEDTLLAERLDRVLG